MTSNKVISANAIIKITPLLVPDMLNVNFDIEGFKGITPTIAVPLSALEAETLDKLCENFTNEVFKKVGKTRPSMAYGKTIPNVSIIEDSNKMMNILESVIRTIKVDNYYGSKEDNLNMKKDLQIVIGLLSGERKN